VSDARDHLALVLDTDDLDDALARARRFAPWFATAKVGYELFAAAGPAAIDALHDEGYAVFVDLKLLDIPTTVGRAARALGRRGAELVNLHAVGGLDMLRAGVAGLAEGAQAGGHPPPVALAVTVLTSEPDGSAAPARLELARAAGCGGVVCAAAEAGAARRLGLAPMVPGIRLGADPVQDQARVATPGDAVRAGAEWILIGRAVSAAADPERAATLVLDEVDAALSERATPGRRGDR
jgi:orotidine-5'-phosphate decarboxylase